MNKDFIKDPFFPECPIRNVLARIGGKWTLAVIYTLGGSETPLRFKDIERANPDCSQKMLTQTLRGLEADGLICRTVYPEMPPRVEYALTDRGRSFLPGPPAGRTPPPPADARSAPSCARYSMGHPTTCTTSSATARNTMNRIENIDFCIRYLMQQNNVEAEIPTTLAEKQRLLRALSNIWEPQPLSDEFLAAQDAELQAQLADKGVVEKHDSKSMPSSTLPTVKDSAAGIHCTPVSTTPSILLLVSN